MEFNNYNELWNYTSKYLNEFVCEKIWHFLQHNMISANRIVEITKNCKSDEECIVNRSTKSAWESFFELHK